MAASSFELKDIAVKYGTTTVRELLDKGYTISDFEQIIDEPALATCNLHKEKEIIGLLSFYNIKEMVSIDALTDMPIDLILVHKKAKNENSKILSSKQAFRNRVLWTVMIHVIAAAIFFGIYAVPALFTWVQSAQFRLNGGAAPVGMVLLVLPALLITFVWGGAAINRRNVATKILLSIWLIVNVVISLVYLVLVDNMFTHRFF